MLRDDVRAVSVDDHVIEPAHVFADHIEPRFHDRAPRIVERDGAEGWLWEDRFYPLAFQGNAQTRKFRPDESGRGDDLYARRYGDMILSAFDVHERVRAMDDDGVWAELLFPTFPRFGGTQFLQAQDRHLALAMVRAWNDWMIDEWCAAHPERFIPQTLVPLWPNSRKVLADALMDVPDDEAGRIAEHNARHLYRFPRMTRARLSVFLPTFAAEDPGSWDHVFDIARAADLAGIDRLVVSDHVVFGENLEAYSRPESGGVEGGRQPTGPDGHWLEPLTVLTAVAAQTDRVRLGTYILLAALRRPVVLAKQLATIDVLSHGRVDLGVGIGWQREEYDAAGLDFGARGRLLDHSLEVCQTLWREPRASFASPELRFEGIHMMPKPVQAGGVPIWVSGRCNGPVARRLARFGSGWIPWGEDAADPVASVGRMRTAVDEAGGDGAALAVLVPLPLSRRPDGALDAGATMDRLGSFVAAGVTDVLAHVRLPDSSAGAQDVYSELVAAFDAAARRCAPPG